MQQSIDLDEKLYKKKLKEQAAKAKDEFYDVEFMQRAVRILLRCRRSLADSYIFIYFYTNDEDTQFLRFDLYQKDLVFATEALSQLLENEVDAENFHALKAQIDKAALYCTKLLRAMYKLMVEGFANNWWNKVWSIVLEYFLTF